MEIDQSLWSTELTKVNKSSWSTEPKTKAIASKVPLLFGVSRFLCALSLDAFPIEYWSIVVLHLLLLRLRVAVILDLGVINR